MFSELGTTPCDVVPDPPTCDHLHGWAAALLEVGAEALTPFLPTGGCGEFVAFVSHARPADDHGNYLAVWLSSLTRPVSFATGQQATHVIQREAVYAVRLLVDIYPTVTASAFPTREAEAAAARYVLAMAAAVWEAIAAAAMPTSGSLLSACVATTFQPMNPIPATGSFIGYEMGVQVAW